VEKYFIFLQVCLGIWTERAIECYDIKDLYVIDDELDRYSDIAEQAKNALNEESAKMTRKERRKFKNKKSPYNLTDSEKASFETTEVDGPSVEKVDHDTHEKTEVAEGIASLIGPRAILLQIIPPLSFLSIYTLLTANVPPYVPNHAVKYFWPYFEFDAYKKAEETEMAEGGHIISAKQRGVRWTIVAESIKRFWNKSRFIDWLMNAFQFAMCVGVLFTDPVSLLFMLHL
jgi:hypothetical protein